MTVVGLQSGRACVKELSQPRSDLHRSIPAPKTSTSHESRSIYSHAEKLSRNLRRLRRQVKDDVTTGHAWSLRRAVLDYPASPCGATVSNYSRSHFSACVLFFRGRGLRNLTNLLGRTFNYPILWVMIKGQGWRFRVMLTLTLTITLTTRPTTLTQTLPVMSA